MSVIDWLSDSLCSFIVLERPLFPPRLLRYIDSSSNTLNRVLFVKMHASMPLLEGQHIVFAGFPEVRPAVFATITSGGG